MPVMDTPDDVEAAVRVNEKGSTLFLLNHGKESKTVVLDRDCRSLCDGKEYKSSVLSYSVFPCFALPQPACGLFLISLP